MCAECVLLHIQQSEAALSLIRSRVLGHLHAFDGLRMRLKNRFLWNRFKSCLERCFNCPSYNAHTLACLALLFLSTGNVICILVSGRLSEVEPKNTPRV